MTETSIPFCAAYDPSPRAPAFKAPPKSCDTHAHVFGPADLYPYSPKRGYTPPDARLAAYQHLHQVLGIERAVLTQPSVYGTDNRAILDVVATDPKRYRAVVAVGRDVTDAELKALDKAGARGIRINLVDKGGMPFDTWDDFEAVAKRIADLGWHVEFLVHVHSFEGLTEKLRRLPVDSVIGHMGYMATGEGLQNPAWRRFVDLVAEGRTWVKLTGPYRITAEKQAPYPDVVPFARDLVAARADRIIWGTDWPHPACKIAMPNDTDLFDPLTEWVPDAPTRHAVLVDNPARLYGF
ncbi:GntR family transcriptional regulator [Phreatobacter aquaticus]|uniref:GntR family transcriptional regulator n=1 Tax=Phreatobacter aquaticus TaxID=2570229 RepID=A0A4D7QHT8_9HYPH|nr:amidohydrolase family protein [Phreatobacter aquaticus]QCK86465.1 GntR family transcriptional regulator [Phreatobacter aquaticus]